MIEHYLDLEGARVVQTPDFVLAMANMRGVIARRAITVLWGGSGYGKTVAARAVYQTLAPGERCWIKLTTRPNPRVLTNAILTNLTGAPHDETRWQSAWTFARELRDREVVIFIDEAQNLSIECIEFVRWLHEEHPGRFALALVGGLQLRARLSRSPQLMRRVFQPSRFEPLDPARVDGYLRGFHPIYRKAAPELIAAIDRQHCRGNFGCWARITATAYDVCRERGLSTITRDIADIAIQRHDEWNPGQ